MATRSDLRFAATTLGSTSGLQDVSDSSTGSPSLRAPSTDAERESSSPSTGSTSYGEEEDEDCEAFPAFASNRTKAPVSVESRGGVAGATETGRSAEGVAASSARWRMPFSRSNVVLKPATSGGTARLSSTGPMPDRAQEAEADGSFVETTSAQAAQEMVQYWNEVKRRQDANGKGPARLSRTLDQDHEGYVVVVRIENGKKIYRIKPRSRPPTALSTRAKADRLAPKTAHTETPSIRLTRSIPNLRPDTAANALSYPTASPLYSISRDHDGFYRPLQAANPVESPDYLHLPPDSSHHLLTPQSASSLTSSGASRHRHSSLLTASSIPNLRAQRDADVFGKLLGWSYFTPPTSVVPSPSQSSLPSPTTELGPGHLQRQGESFVTARTHQSSGSHIDQPPLPNPSSANSPAHGLQIIQAIKHEDRRYDYQTPVVMTFAEAGTDADGRADGLERTPQRLVEASPRSNSSPFGQGVRLPSSPRLRRRKSFSQRPVVEQALASTVPSSSSQNSIIGKTIQPEQAEQDHSEDIDVDREIAGGRNIKVLREAASSETIRTSRHREEEDVYKRDFAIPVESEEPSHTHNKPALTAFPTLAAPPDISIFDMFQDLESKDAYGRSSSSLANVRESLNVDSQLGKRHERGLSSASLSSAISLQSASSFLSNPDNPYEITVTKTPGDDPRFVLWGIKVSPGGRSSQVPSSNAHQPSPDAASPSGRHDPGSRKDSSASAGSSTAPSHGRRWSNTLRRSAAAPEALSASPASPHCPAPGQKVLMAATLERWIAEMTSKIGSDLMTDFFLTYRSFLSPLGLCQLLTARFEWALLGGETPEDIAGRRIVRVRTYVVIRHWLLNYFHEDFVPERALRVLLTDWLNKMGKDARLRANPIDLRLIKSLKKVVKKLKAAYSTVAPGQPAPHPGDVRAPTRPRVGRNRSDTILSISSISSNSEIHPTGSLTSPSKGIDSGHRGPLDGIVQPAAGTASGSERDQHLSRADLRTSSSEDDVDLNIDIHASGYDSDERPSMPPVFPISPPRSRHPPPPRPSASRSPRHGDRSPRALSTLPTMPENNRLSRYITSTVGSLGKLKRIIKQRDSSPSYPAGLNNSMNSISGPRPEGGDLLYSKGDLDSYLKRCGIETHTGVTISGLGIRGQAESSQQTTPKQNLSQSVGNSSSDPPRHIASSWTVPDASRDASPQATTSYFPNAPDRTFIASPAENSLAPPLELGSNGSIIQLDDYDSSDDESDYGGKAQVLKTIRRLPAARDLRTAGYGQAPSSMHRHSMDTVSSYGTRRIPSIAAQPVRIPSFATYDSGSSVKDEGGEPLTENVVPFFVTPSDSDDDEPGDVEAALRRLEGQVDQDKQKSNAKKVEEYLKKSEEARVHGAYATENEEDEDGSLAEDGDDEISISSRRSVQRRGSAESATDKRDNPVIPPISVVVKGVAGEEGTLQTPNVETTTELEISQQHNFPVPANDGDIHRLTAATKRVQRKSSVRRFFTSTRLSTNIRPLSIAPNLAPPPSAPPAHRSFLLQYRTEALAQHFCIIERDLLEKVSWQELVSGDWRERHDTGEVTDWDVYLKQRARLNAVLQDATSPGGKAKKAGDVQVIIQRFNIMCNWIASEVVLTTHTTERALLIAKIIRLAFKCYRLYNFQTVTQLVHGLQSPWIERLKRTWSKVPAFELRLFSQLKFFCSHLRNFRLLRDATEALAQQWGPPGQEPGAGPVELAGVPGTLPFFGLILRDLAVTSELPSFLDPSSPRAPAVLEPGTQTLAAYVEPQVFAELRPIPPSLPIRPLINVHKYRTIAGIIQKVMTYKELANLYPYEPDLATYRKCLTLHCLPTPLIQKLSMLCEK